MLEPYKRIWHLDESCKNLLNSYQKALIIVGPSGSGKSTCANYIESKYNYQKLNLYTTREKRNSILENSVISLSKASFIEKVNSNSFFLYRIGIDPFYGYLKTDLDNIIRSGKKPILMFRNHGIRFLMNVLPTMNVVFIIGNAKEISQHSESVSPKFSETDVQKALDSYQCIMKCLEKKGLKYYTIYNNYENAFYEKIDSIILGGKIDD